jgi:hypothetical protein
MWAEIAKMERGLKEIGRTMEAPDDIGYWNIDGDYGPMLFADPYANSLRFSVADRDGFAEIYEEEIPIPGSAERVVALVRQFNEAS